MSRVREASSSLGLRDPSASCRSEKAIWKELDSVWGNMAHIDEESAARLRNMMPDGVSGYPTLKGAEIVASKKLTKGSFGWKAILLVKVSRQNQQQYELRLYSWGFSRKKNDWYQRGRFTVRPARYIYDIVETLTTLVEERDISPRAVKTLEDKVDSLERMVAAQEKKKSKIPEMKKKTKEFEKLLNSPTVSERDIHAMLKREAWMFGAHYQNVVKSEKAMTIKSRDDFLLKRIDDYYDIVELKSPKANLFVNKGVKRVMSRDLKDSISQVIGYLTEKRKYYLSVKDQTGIDAFFPKGIIVIGRTKPEDRELLKAHKEFLHSLDIWTYDDLLFSANRAIEILKDIKVKR